MTKNKIISYAKILKETCNTNDPFMIAGQLGIEISDSNVKKEAVPAYILKPFDDKPAKILINPHFNKKSKKVLCAHELGHALLHKSAANHFSPDSLKNKNEYEANLFAVSLLFDEKNFNIKFENMSNYILKSVLDHNITY